MLTCSAHGKEGSREAGESEKKGRKREVKEKEGRQVKERRKEVMGGR